MLTIDENNNIWSNYDWSRAGNEWSEYWGGPEYMWILTIYPRIQTFLPTNNILEIAPGYGRVTQYLHKFCKRLTIVDLTEKCITSCKNRFKNAPNISYFVNDGKSLGMITDNSIDFVCSWDSLVHADKDVLDAYLKEISKKLTANGVGFIHHSNMATYIDTRTDSLTIENKHWRDVSMSAKLFEKYCDDTGLQCIRQEIINWGGIILNDCFSLFTRKNSRYAIPNRIMENKCFDAEINHSKYIANIYTVNPRSTYELIKETFFQRALEKIRRLR